MFKLEYILHAIYNPKSVLQTILYNVLSYPAYQQYIAYDTASDRFEFPMSKLFEISPNVKWCFTQEGFRLRPKSIAGTKVYISLRKKDDKISFWMKSQSK